jgi:hypothetical protein
LRRGHFGFDFKVVVDRFNADRWRKRDLLRSLRCGRSIAVNVAERLVTHPDLDGDLLG